MPHLVLEYAAPLSAQVDLVALLKKAHQALCTAPTVNPEAVKSRLSSYEHFQIGTVSHRLFLHIELRLLAGRPLDVRLALRDAIVAIVMPALPAETAFSFEIREMTPETYITHT
ncbi:MAG: 5-carboxymethyl-2-hydroxymuconate Delta-isomerase [Holosporales bacterium]